MTTKTDDLEARILYGSKAEVEMVFDKLAEYFRIHNRKYVSFIVYDPNLDKLTIEMYSMKALRDEIQEER